MRISILMDNIAGEGFLCEWGFSAFAEFEDKKFLIDTGSSEKYLINARKMGIDISDTDHAFLSHAHYDHSGGFEEFFRLNNKAKLTLSSNCKEDCCKKIWIFNKYIGIPKGMMKNNSERIDPAQGFKKICENVYTVPHIGKDLESIGLKAGLYRKVNGKTMPEDFSHEQSVVFDTKNGLVVFNSCSHAGLDSIIEDINYFLPGKEIYMTVGGLHLSKYDDEYVKSLAKKIKLLNIKNILTGHCTGNRAFEILKTELGDKIKQTYSGMVIDLQG